MTIDKRAHDTEISWKDKDTPKFLWKIPENFKTFLRFQPKIYRIFSSERVSISDFRGFAVLLINVLFVCVCFC